MSHIFEACVLRISIPSRAVARPHARLSVPRFATPHLAIAYLAIPYLALPLLALALGAAPAAAIEG
ncbi:hypothetical protein [Methylobacterium sp. WL103]|nr:hypothetical protein [Methylobacterium sp. WL103]